MKSSPMLPASAPRVVRGYGWAVGCLIFIIGFGLLAWATWAGTTTATDHMLADAVTASRTATLSLMARFFTSLGSWPVLVAVSLAVSGALFLRTRQPSTVVALLASTAVTAALVYLLKIALGRARPDLGTLLGSPAFDGSFPSGHTTNGSLTWMSACLLFAVAARHRLSRATALVLGLLLAAGIGWSRVYLGYHWPTDVLAGWLLASAVVFGEIFLLVNITTSKGISAVLRGAIPAASQAVHLPDELASWYPPHRSPSRK